MYHDGSVAKFWRIRHLPVCAVLMAVVSVFAALTAVSGCASGETPGPNEVFMRNIAFDPMEITIKTGETVTWTNMDKVPHTATSGNPGDADLGSFFRSAQLTQGQTFAHTFNDAGEFIYFCEVHPGIMRNAKVIVAAP